MNVKAIRQNALARLEASATKRKPEMRGKKEVSGNKQTVALRLLAREEQNARRSRMESLLTQQFVGKYGSKQPNSRINSFIKATVVDFINSHDNINVAESMIDSVEAQIREITANMKRDINEVRRESRQVAELERLKQAKMEVEAKKAGRGGRRTGSLRGAMEEVQLDASGNIEPSWAVLNAIRATEAEKLEEEKKKKAIQRSEKYKTDLDAQRDFLRSTRDTGEQDKREQHALNMKAAAEHEAEQERQKTQKLQHHASERVLRLKQIQENEMRREKEKQIKIMQEKADMARSRRLAEAEAQALAEKKEKGRLAVEKVKQENEVNKQLKEAARQKQWEYEAKLNRDYEAKLEKEEMARNKAFQDRVDALKKFEKAGEGAALEKERAESDEMARTMEKMEAKYEADAQKLRDKELQRRKDMQRSREFNMTLIEKKKKKVEDEKRADLERRIQQQKELDAEKERNEKKKAEKLQAMSKLKEQLDQQVLVRENANRFQKTAGLSDLEKQLNGSLIEKIKADPGLYKKVMHKVNPTPRGSAVEFKYG